MSETIHCSCNLFSNDRGAHATTDLQSTSFKDFMKTISECTNSNLNWDNGNNRDVSYDDVRSFLTDVMRQANATTLTNEEELQKLTFGHLKRAGTRTLENTSNGIKNFNRYKVAERMYATDSSAGDFRKLGLSRFDQDSKRADLVLRVAVDGDEDLDVSSVAGPSLPVSRIAPWCIVTQLDFKARKVSLIDHLDQGFEYCLDVIKISPGREMMVTALTNFSEIVYIAAVSMNDVVRLYHSGIINEANGFSQARLDKVWIDEMSEFFGSKNNYLGFVDGVNATLVPSMIEALGRGSYSATVRLNNGVRPVLKISRNIHAIANEIVVTRAVRESVVQSSELDTKTQAALLSRLPDCVVGNSFNFSLHRAACTKISKFGPSHILRSYEVLKYVHRAGYVHRDIRRANMMMHMRRVCLIDFSSAHRPDGVAYTYPADSVPDGMTEDTVVEVPPGGLATASIPVIKSFYERAVRNGHYRCTFNDEIISLIHLSLHHHPCNVSRFYKWFPKEVAEGNTAHAASAPRLSAPHELAKIRYEKAIFRLQSVGSITEEQARRLVEIISGLEAGVVSGEVIDPLACGEVEESRREKYLKEALDIVGQRWFLPRIEQRRRRGGR